MKLSKDVISISIDTSNVTVGELIEKLEEIFPNGRWADFKIEKEFNPTTPIYIERNPYNPYPNSPWWGEPIVTYSNTLNKLMANTETSTGVNANSNQDISRT